MIVEQIQALRPGDRVRVDTWACSQPDPELEVVRREQGDVVGVSDQGVEYYVIESYWGGEHGWVGRGQPWLRTVENFDSRGEIKEVIPLANAGDE